MPQRWSTHFAIWFFAFAMSFGNCVAQPAIDAQVALQICQAFSMKSPEQMPAIVRLDATEDFLQKYGSFSGQLQGCLSATETKREPNSVTFLIQNTRYESYWKLSTDDSSIKAISILRYRPVTLADDGLWISLIRDYPHTIDYQGGVPIDGGPDFVPAADPNIVEFFYATNRQESKVSATLEGNPQETSNVDGRPIYSANGWTAVSGYTGERSAHLSFGAVRVRVPEGHHIGKLELPSDSKIFSFSFFGGGKVDPTKHFTLRSIEKTDEDSWVKSLSSIKPSPSTNRKTALVFVHGFNTKFRDSVFRTAQIVWDLQFHGTTVLFSWPSRGEIADYLYDKDSALGSREAVLHIVADVHKAGFEEINIIAHSMGNLIAVDALSNSAATQSPAAIAQFIMAAPDVDRDMFIQEIPKLAKVAKGLTLYASANDKALQLSKRVAGDIPRAGDVPASGPVVIASLTTIDVSAIGDELFGLNHNAFATTRSVLNDLKLLLETGAPPPRLAEIHGYPAPPLKPLYFRYAQ